jgi:hypothetical protein
MDEQQEVTDLTVHDERKTYRVRTICTNCGTRAAMLFPLGVPVALAICPTCKCVTIKPIIN